MSIWDPPTFVQPGKGIPDFLISNVMKTYHTSPFRFSRIGFPDTGRIGNNTATEAMLLSPQSQSQTPGRAAALPFYSHPPPTPRGRAPQPSVPAPTLHLSFSCYSLASSSPLPKLVTTSISDKKPFKPCTITRGRSSNDPRESVFFDEDGVVQDMDGYLNYLSLEYDSVWDTKPSWCQPWTITLTGVLVIAGSWLILHSVVVTAGVLGLICAWWYIFLYSYPKAYLEMIAERRKRVTSGVEDTYGLGRYETQAEGGDAGPSTK